MKKRGDKERWKTTFDGFYLTRGFHSNNSSATLHDYESGGIAWYTHRTKRGAGHNWKGTSGGSWAGDDESNCGLAYHTDRNDKPVDSEVLVVSTEGGEAVVAPDTVTG